MVPEALRALAILAIKDSKSSDQDIANTLRLKRSTVYSIRKAFIEDGREHSKKRGGNRPQKLADAQQEAILDWIDEDCTQPLKRIADRVNTEFDIQVSRQTIGKILKEFHYSIKRVSLIPERRNCPEVIEKRYVFAMRMLENAHNRHKIFFLDEVGFNFCMRSINGWSQIGTRANVTVPQIRSRNFSCAAVMSRSSLYYFKVLDKPYNTSFFREFILEILQKFYAEQITNTLLVCDNVAFHRNPEIQSLIRANGHETLFLAPYSPFLNPIEELFSQWKHHVRHAQPRNTEDLLVAINNAAANITEENCKNYVEHMETYYPLCLQRRCIEN